MHNNQESGKLNENESDHTEEIEVKGNQHDQALTGQSHIQEEMFDYQEYNKAENFKESDDRSLESSKSVRQILAQLIEKVDTLTVEVRSSKKEAAPISIPGNSGTIHRNESNDNLTKDLLLQCTSVTEITDKLSEFSFNEERTVMICNECVTAEQVRQVWPDKLVHGIFSYNPAMDEDPLSNPEFNCDVQSEAFRNLKKHLRRHLTGILHNNNLDAAASTEKLKSKEERRECSVGMKIGKTCYYLFKKARPDTDFPDLLLLQSMNELDIGELNHCEKFPAKFIPYVAEEVEHRVNFLNNRLDQTAFRPVGKVVADKATYKHRTQQFVYFITVVPNSTILIQSIFLDIHVTAEQYQGGSYDGQYHHLSVPELLDGHFGFTGTSRKFSDWDPMHIAGTRDAAIRKETQFSWLVQITEDISSLFKAINWGQEFEHFFSVAERLKSDESFDADVFRGLPMFYSETKFANHCAKVYEQLCKDYPALFSTLEETQMNNFGVSNAKSRQTASDAARLKNKLANKKFALTHSGVCDIYDTFGHGINILQIVSILPHERFDKFHEVCIEKLLQMSKFIECHEKCTVAHKCYTQTKSFSTQTKLTARKQKLTAQKQKLTAQKQKLTVQKQKLTAQKRAQLQ